MPFKQNSTQADLKPIEIEPLAYEYDASMYFSRLKSLEHCVWLDSGKPSSHYGRYDIFSALPINILSNAKIDDIQRAVDQLFHHVDIEKANALALPFLGGAIGYFNYEYNNADFKLPSYAKTNVNSTKETSDEANSHTAQSAYSASMSGIFDWCLIQDHHQQQAYALFLPTCDASKKQRIRDALQTNVDNKQTFTVKNLVPNIEKKSYLQAIKKIHTYIMNGDTYQINFAQRFTGEFDGCEKAAYLKLRNKMPSPFSAFIDLSSDKILSFSPERFIHLDNGNATTQPIKGTIRRSENSDEDKTLAENLKHSSKNRAENLMIVDLLRNDFNKYCLAHTVKTPKLFALESFSNVHHLVSTVCGKLKNKNKPLEFLLGCFPGGSITGAPKKRAMEIIQELEDYPRNIYCGSIYYATANGKVDSNITIRTVSIQNDNDRRQCICWGGGGIVADSTPEEEYQESLQKIQILLDALTEK